MDNNLYIQFGAFLLVPAFAILGAASCQYEWLGGIAGGCLGLFLASIVSGIMPAKIVDALFPGEPVEKEDTNSLS